MNPRNWRTLIAVLFFGLIASACAGSTSDATAGEADTTAEAPAVAEEIEEAPEPEAVEEEPADADEPAAPAEEGAVEVSPVFEGSFVDLNGDAIDLASYQGQDVVLWFWAPW